MKKVLLNLLGVALILSMAGVVGAGTLIPNPLDYDADVSSSLIVVTYSVSESYVVNIPDSITVGTKYNVYLEGPAIINSDKFLNVYINSTNNWKLIEDLSGNDNPGTPASIPYSLSAKVLIYSDLVQGYGSTQNILIQSDADEPYKQTLIFTSKAGRDPVASDLTFNLLGTAAHAGTYKDTVTFTVKIQTQGETESAYPPTTQAST